MGKTCTKEKLGCNADPELIIEENKSEMQLKVGNKDCISELDTGECMS